LKPILAFPIVLLFLLTLSACTGGANPINTWIPAQASPTDLTPTKTRPAASTTPIPSATSTTQGSTPTPEATASPTQPDCLAKGGKIVKGELDTDLLLKPLEYRLYLPPCYFEERDRRYPVLYLIHGQSYNDDQWDRLGADETADDLIAEGEIAPFLIAMPRDRTWEQPTEDMFGEAVVEVLIPFIDQNYRTLPGRTYRAVGGLSRGAGWAVHLGLSHWELFGAIGCHSLPVFHSDTSRIRKWLDAIPPEALPRIYLDIGDRDRPNILRSALWFEDILTQKKIPHEWYLFSGYHEEAYWKAHLEQYLRWYAQNW